MTVTEAMDQYLTKAWSLREFEAWLLARMRQIQGSDDDRLITLANELDADLVEFSEGLLDEGTLSDRWNARLRHWSTIYRDERPHVDIVTLLGTSVHTQRATVDYAPPHLLDFKFQLA